eukprot:CAMPEP_0117570506 /NCGR_PEP_ID=MMETSP0784-20121206/59235_1 /TAXON_ID=39447 /ORGANISM="" /LENGTH=236 /DNA_ID=CAMNT_0005368565 /DNA_START=67 /DNA_END=776 /DNA_ORIENTATION=-
MAMSALQHEGASTADMDPQLAAAAPPPTRPAHRATASDTSTGNGSAGGRKDRANRRSRHLAACLRPPPSRACPWRQTTATSASVAASMRGTMPRDPELPSTDRNAAEVPADNAAIAWGLNALDAAAPVRRRAEVEPLRNRGGGEPSGKTPEGYGPELQLAPPPPERNAISTSPRSSRAALAAAIAAIGVTVGAGARNDACVMEGAADGSAGASSAISDAAAFAKHPGWIASEPSNA